MFSAGMRPTLARTRSPSTDGNPSRSSATTPTETVPLAEDDRPGRESPRFSRAGFGVPMPPETGRSGSGVITRHRSPDLDFSPGHGLP